MTRLEERIENFNKAFLIFSDAVKAYKDNDILTHMALIQSFEIVFELGWKVLKDYLAEKGIIANYPKDIIKEAFATETIQNGQIWMDMLKDRNISSHEYNLDKVNVILGRINTLYFEELNLFQKQLKDIYE